MRDQLLFAPFWVDVDIRREGNVWYGSHASDNVTTRADDLVHQSSPQHWDFKSQAVYVATWEDVPNYPDGSFFFSDEKSSLRNTFQVALITDFKNTFLAYCYSDIGFTGRQQSAVVGYSAGDGRQFFNQPGSLTDDIREVSQVERGDCRGLLFFHLTPTGLLQSNAGIQCRDWYCDDQDQFGVTPQWLSSLVPCPWTWFHAFFDPRYILVSFTSEHGLCFIQASVFFDFVDGKLLTPETECCYQFVWFNPVPPFGGSSSPYHRFSPILYHRELYDQLTAQPYIWCCLESSNCDLYFERRPIQSTHSYRPLLLGTCISAPLTMIHLSDKVNVVVGWLFGDPHIQTMDGKTYTFNGHGEYILMKTSNESFVLQGRTELAGEGNSTATVFTAFAMAHSLDSDNFAENEPSSTVLHVQLGTNNTLQIYARNTGHTAFTNITSNFTALSNSSILTLDNVTILRPNNETFQALYGSDISVRVEAKKGLLTVVFAGPEELMGETRGLLGVWDDDLDNDLTARNGTVLPSDSSDRTIHNVFGLSCKAFGLCCGY